MSPKISIKSKIGAHVSIAGGIDKAPERAFSEGCETFQCFTRPPQGGPAPVLTPEIVANFKAEMKKYDFENFYIHTPYYLNFASLEPRIREASIKVAREELERGSLLGAKYVMTHLGSSVNQTVEEGIKKVIDAVSRVLDGYDGSTKLLLEIAAGSGNIIGGTFEEIGEILREVNKGLPPHSCMSVGVNFDTCHAFASGYDFRTEAGTMAMLKEFDQKIGFEWLKLTHVNDSKFDLNGKKDRHEHIGKGFIGEKGIINLLKTDPFSKIDWILETETEGREMDIKKLKQIKFDTTK